MVRDWRPVNSLRYSANYAVLIFPLNCRRYVLKLFRDYVFHSVDEMGHPVLDLTHVLLALNKVSRMLRAADPISWMMTLRAIFSRPMPAWMRKLCWWPETSRAVLLCHTERSAIP
jgi:hypothetical protein